MRKLLLLGLFVIGLSVALLSFFNFGGLAANGEYETILLDLKDDLPAQVEGQSLEAIAQQYNVIPQLDNKFSAKDNVYIVKGDRNLLGQLKSSPIAKLTEIIEPNYIYKIPESDKAVPLGAFLNKKVNKEKKDPDEVKSALKGPNDPYYSKQWNLHNINVTSAWEKTKGKDITVAVIDTGVSRVRDLVETEFVEGYDFVNDREKASDDNGHGTHVAGTIAQATNNFYGVAGIAYEAKLMPLKVLSESGAGTVADIAEAIKFAADNGADVINMSLGGGGESKLMAEAIEYAYKKGVVIIGAAGNENHNAASYPARYPYVIGVAAIGAGNEKASYSNYGAGVDISAPGGDESNKILQETIDPETKNAVFVGFQGTSMAAPHVAGVAALVKAMGAKDPDEVLQYLQQSARVVQDDPLNYYGAGQLNAEAAVNLAAQGHISFQDFFRWLRENGYLNLRFWIDGGAVALLPKLAMVIGSYLLAWFLRVYFPFNWSWAFSGGLIAGSSGLFFLRGLYIFDLPQWPFRLLGSSLPEVASAVPGSTQLNPLFASVLLPLGLLALLLGHSKWKWFAIGATIGTGTCLAVNAFVDPPVWGLGDGLFASIFLLANAILCVGLARLIIKGEAEKVPAP